MRTKLFIEKLPTLKHVKLIFEQCEWGNPPEAMLIEVLENSWVSCMAYSEDNKPIGFARIISDKKVYAL